MHTLYLTPTDVLYFRDGRPMDGAFSGHGAAWPLPQIAHQALHAALHRGFPEPRLQDGEHLHFAGRNIKVNISGKPTNRDETRKYRFGEITTVGPFPVCPDGKWLFPCPADAQGGDNLNVTHFPNTSAEVGWSSLPTPLKYPVSSALPPSKDTNAKNWIAGEAYQNYLNGNTVEKNWGYKDSDFSDTESQIGIAIDPETGTTGQGDVEGQIYSAQYLRLREGWRMGLYAGGIQKNQNGGNVDFVARLFERENKIVVGGQQRVCSVERNEFQLKLPLGLTQAEQFKSADGKYRVKWVLLTPAIYPETQNPAHSGGWLPNWINPADGKVMLVHGGMGKAKAERMRRHGKTVKEGDPINAHLVAAIIPKPIVITGWSLGLNPITEDKNQPAPKQGAKSTHLAVAAGAVYYFETDSAVDAANLATALNWHGKSTTVDSKATINRRSAIWGEKGYGIGVCGTWQPFSSNFPSNECK